jgi:hypothetical protein
MQGGRVAIEPAQVFDIGGFDVVVHGAVIAPESPVLGQFFGKLYHLGNFHLGIALVCQPQSLIVDIAVAVPGFAQHFLDPVLTPHRPVVHAVHDFSLVAPHGHGLIQIF